MRSWRNTFREGFVAGGIASLASAVVLVIAGRREPRRPAAPVNAISHWLWGDRALRRDEPSLRHTLVGYLIHHAASIFWATLHARAWGERREAKKPMRALAGAAVAASVACVVDLRLTPHRLTPGFEHRLSARSLAAVYASFAVGLAIGSMMAGRR